MMHYADSVTRAADALLTERYGNQKPFKGRYIIIRGYTADVVEQSLLPVIQPAVPSVRQAAVFNVAA